MKLKNNLYIMIALCFAVCACDNNEDPKCEVTWVQEDVKTTSKGFDASYFPMQRYLYATESTRSECYQYALDFIDSELNQYSTDYSNQCPESLYTYKGKIWDKVRVTDDLFIHNKNLLNVEDVEKYAKDFCSHYISVPENLRVESFEIKNEKVYFQHTFEGGQVYELSLSSYEASGLACSLYEVQCSMEHRGTINDEN
jgi:hypothetical protein